MRWVAAVGVLLFAMQAAWSADDWNDWLIHPQPIDDNQLSGKAELRYLFEENGRYRLLGMGKKTDPRFELIAFDLEKQTILLLTSPYERPEFSSRPENRLRCTAVTGAEYRKYHYSICNSRFALRQDDMVQVDTKKLKQVLQEVNFLSMVAELRMAQYRTDFAGAKTAAGLSAFVEHYSTYDPEGLVSLARSRIPGQQLSEYENDFAAAMEEPIRISTLPRKLYLQRFIDRYQNNDPKRFTLKAEAELARLADLEEQQKQEQWKQAATIGRVVCLEAPLLTDQTTITGYIQIVGFTERATSDKIKVLVNRILSRAIATPWKHRTHDNAIVGDINISIGAYSWFERDGWRLCQ